MTPALLNPVRLAQSLDGESVSQLPGIAPLSTRLAGRNTERVKIRLASLPTGAEQCLIGTGSDGALTLPFAILTAGQSNLTFDYSDVGDLLFEEWYASWVGAAPQSVIGLDLSWTKHVEEIGRRNQGLDVLRQRAAVDHLWRAVQRCNGGRQ